MALISLPVRNDLPEHQFRIEIEGTVYTLRFRWNQRYETWFMDIADAEDTDILNGVACLSNRDMIGHIRNNNIPPGIFITYDETGQERDPDRTTFGNDVKLFYEESTGA